MCLGVGCAFGSYICGYLSDKMPYRKICYIGAFMTLLSYFMAFVSLDNQNLVISLFTSYISGFTMFFTNNMLVIMCAKLYDGNL